MKYIWENMTDDDKCAAVHEELRLKTHMGTTKDDLLEIVRFLSGEVEQYNRALKAACEHIAIIQDSICPADMDGFDGDCSMCGNNDVIDCWVEHYLQQAKAGEANATTL